MSVGSQWQRVKWAQFKEQVDARGASIQEIKMMDESDPQTVKTYRLRLIDGEFKIECFIHADGDMPTELTDYTTNYQASANQKVEPRDTTGRPITRKAITNDGWHYQLQSIEFTTAKLASIYNKDENGNDLGFGSIKLYKADGTEITQQIDEVLAVKTVIDWQVDHEMDIVGGRIFQAAPPATDCRVWITAAPGILDIKFGQGGINLKLAGVGGGVNADGRASKYLPTVPSGVNKFRMTFLHVAGLQHTAMMVFELFKP